MCVASTRSTTRGGRPVGRGCLCVLCTTAQGPVSIQRNSWRGDIAMVFAIAKRWPLGFAMGFGAIKTVAADALVQKYMEGKETLDRRRLGVFFTFGLVQVGFVQYQLYVNAFSWAFTGAAKFAALPFSAKLKDVVGLRNLAKQVLVDQMIYHPLCYFPVFYTCKEIIQGEATSPPDAVRRAITNYVPNAVEDLKALWQIFFPTAIVQFSVMPMHLRVPFTATVGFFWCGILSWMRGAQLAEEPVLIRRASRGAY